MTLLRVVLLVCIAAAAARADERADRLLAAFTNICLAKPDSIGAMNRLAMAQGFSTDTSAATAIADAESRRADPFNLLIFWHAGAGDSRMKLTGLTAGKAEQYEFGCWLDGDGVEPDGILATLKARLGEPAGSDDKSGRVEVNWTIAGRQQSAVKMTYRRGARRVGLSVTQVLGEAAAKPQ